MKSSIASLLVLACLAGGVAACAEDAVDEETRKAREKWKESGVDDPVEVEMMRIWEKMAKPHGNLKEWDIHYSPGRKFAVIYRYHKVAMVRDGPSTLTYFRLEEGVPVFLRHDEWPEMVYDAINDDGVALVMTFNRCSALWHVANLDGKKWQGMFLAADPGLIQVEPDGSFGIADPIADYRVSVKDGAAALEIKELHEDAVLETANFTDFTAAHLPTGITEELALDFARSLEALEVKADRIWARKPKDPLAWFVRTYTKDAVPVLRDPKKSYEKDVEIPLPLVKDLLPSIVKRRDEPEK